MVRLGGQHALHVVVDVAKDDAVPLGRASPRTLALESLDMKTLHHRDRVLRGCAAGVEENGPRSGSDGISTSIHNRVCQLTLSRPEISVVPPFWVDSLIEWRRVLSEPGVGVGRRWKLV